MKSSERNERVHRAPPFYENLGLAYLLLCVLSEAMIDKLVVRNNVEVSVIRT